MAETEEPRFNSLAERIAALNQQRNFTTPSSTKRPPPPPPNRPPSRTPSQVNSPPLDGASQNATPVVPARPAKRAPPALPQRSNTEPQNGLSPNHSLAPQRQPSEQISPALPPRRPSTQSLTTRRNSNESVKSHASSISALSLNQAAGYRSNDGRKLPPPLEQADLPPLPPTRREREAAMAKEHEEAKAASTARMAKPPLLPKRSMPALPQADNARPSLPPRLPSRPARSPGLNGAEPSPPAQPSRRLPPPPDKFIRTIPEVSGNTSGGTPAAPSNDVPPPVPIASRPSAAQIDAAAASSAAQQAASCLVCRDFSVPDQVAGQYPASTLDRRDPVGHLANVLCGPFPSPTDKARAIFIWCHHNIAYDVQGFFGGCIQRGTASDTIFSGKAVCEGYARVYEAIAKRAGLECIVVGGHGKGFGFSPLKEGERPPPRNATGHAWNAVKIDNGYWKLLDACWGAGSVGGQSYNKHFSPHHFTASNEMFGMSHFPENPRHFFRDDGRTPSWEEYFLGGATGERTQWFSNAIEEGLNEWCSSPTEKKIPVYSGEVVRFQFAKVCEHWTSERNGLGKPKLLMMQIHGVDGRKDDTVPCESDGFWWWCDIPARDLGSPGQKVQLIALKTLGEHDGRGVTKADFLSKKGRYGMSFDIYAQWELV
ncbi:transglutaminase-like superfamily protein [Diaporthe amygdali]|uniref:transglutaminase-like superfamily protein n=1 Tax=Phomopsis amygdali TaxID=1214568 RepID=UPI0022FE38A2|nr:transglutaminase-like superfamily protein [Diaporthe amygdali]KAJ0115292.1 transglutaminase-like superfamily protein [Diaporthe amygdali]